ncbi:Arm DNA-binding domain-containing protein [Prevotella melaninogenica]|nr:Arm DNA-binding domain-containing protein [Prevotella melaninogenica]
MKSIFRTSFYLRSNYLNKDGKASIMMRIHLNGERMALGTTGVLLQ